MHPGKPLLLIILLVTLGICGVAFLGRNGGRCSSLAKILVAALLGVSSLINAYFGVTSISRGSVSLAKHGTSLTFSSSDSPFLYAVLVAFFFLLAFVLGYGAILVGKGRLLNNGA